MSNNPNILSSSQSQKELVYAIRESFFDDLLHEWSRPPQDIDRLMGQEEFFLLPDFASEKANHPSTVMIKDVEHGILAASVTPSNDNISQDLRPDIRIVYSIMQAGDWIRFGFLLQGDPKLLMLYQQHNDHLLSVESIWDRPCDYQFRDGGGILVEWRFAEPDFYNNFVIQIGRAHV